MNILIINWRYKFGGAEIQSLREKKILEQHGHDVYYVTIDPGYKEMESSEENHINIRNYNKFETAFYKYVIDYVLYNRLLKIINQFSPDFIHINNIHSLAAYKILKGKNTLQTIRDFGIICPNGTCCDLNHVSCIGYNCRLCNKKCKPTTLMQKIYRLYKLTSIKIENKYRRKYIKQFACPSQCLTDLCNEYDIRTKCINNQFDFSLLDSFNKDPDFNKKIFLYYGIINKQKGILQLIKAFNKFSTGKNDVELHIVGKIVGDEKEFQKSLSENSKIKYLGIFEYKDILSKLEKVHTVIVPSLWMENFPNTVVEAMATKCVVLGTNRGGIPELIRDKKWQFNVLDTEDIENAILRSYELTYDEWIEIGERNYKLINEIADQERYYSDLSKYFS